MARLTSPRGKLSRREGLDLDLFSGVTPLENKCKAKTAPGQHGANRSRLSDYGLQLREKQKVRRIYGVLEKPFRNYYAAAARKKGATGTSLLQLLELRLDNIVYRMGFGVTRREARQIVNHKSIKVNGSVVSIPSYQVKVGDVIEVTDKAKTQLRVQAAMEIASQRPEVEWLSVEAQKFTGVVEAVPTREQLSPNINENLIVELYSK